MTGRRKHPRWNPEAHQADPKPARVPHADRPTARDHCKCLWVHSTNAAGEKTEHLYTIHPECKLHGDHVERSPF